MQISDFQTAPQQRGVSIDADVALWLDNLAYNGKPPLPQAQHFVLLTRDQHREFDIFKESYPEETKLGFSTFPITPLLSFWNEHRSTPSPLLSLFNKHYIQLSSAEVDTLCDWIYTTRNECISYT